MNSSIVNIGEEDLFSTVLRYGLYAGELND